MNPHASRERRQERLAFSESVKRANLPPDLEQRIAAFPDPWLFDSEKLIRELDRCREMVLLIPVNGDTQATHIGINNAISAIWNLREQLRYLLHLHKQGQREFARKASNVTATPVHHAIKPKRIPQPTAHRTAGF